MTATRAAIIRCDSAECTRQEIIEAGAPFTLVSSNAFMDGRQMIVGKNSSSMVLDSINWVLARGWIASRGRGTDGKFVRYARGIDTEARVSSPHTLFTVCPSHASRWEPPYTKQAEAELNARAQAFVPSDVERNLAEQVELLRAEVSRLTRVVAG